MSQLSPHLDATVSEDQCRTPSPRDDSQDESEYTPTRQSNRSGIVWVTPSQRSSTSSIATNTRTALDVLYETLYGQNSIHCLLTQGEGGLNVAHAVRRASKSPQLTLYEYCLGLELGTFHVDSRRNIFYLQSHWHLQFDADRWILLPSTVVLEDICDFARSVIAARNKSAPAKIPDFYAKWPLKSKYKYTFIPLPSIKRDPITRPKSMSSLATAQPTQQWDTHSYPYRTVPDLECHVAPPFSVINAGPKCMGTDLDAITLGYCESDDSRLALKHRLGLLCEIWKLFQNTMEDASSWQRDKVGKRTREQEDEDIERLTQSSQRTTRSQSRASQGPTGNSMKRSRKRKASPSLCGSTLTERAVLHLTKRQKTSDFRTTVKHWVESMQS